MLLEMPGSKSDHNWRRDPACKGKAAVNNSIPDDDGDADADDDDDNGDDDDYYLH